MQNINYPGEIGLAIHHFIALNPRLVYKFWRISLFIFALVGTLSIYFTGRSDLFTGKRNYVVRLLRNPSVFIILMGIGLIFFRIPNLIAPEQNADEGQFIATAASFYAGSVFWRDVGAAHGPLITVPLCLMNVLGFGLSYATARIFGILCILVAIIFLWKTLSEFYNDTLARIIILPLTLFFAYANLYDKMAYTSEQVPVLLISICLYLLIKSCRSDFESLTTVFLLGFFLGMLPLAKLTTVPIGLMIGGLAAFEIYRTKNAGLRYAAARMSLLIISALVPLMLMGIYLIRNDAVATFWQDYIMGNILYSKVGLRLCHYTGIKRVFIIILMLKQSGDSLFYLVATLFLPVLAYIVNHKKVNIKSCISDKYIFYPFLILAASYYGVIMPGNNFPNYLLLLIAPLAIWTGAILWGLIQPDRNLLTGKIFFVPYVIILLVCIASAVRYETKGIYSIEMGDTYGPGEISVNILKYAQPNEKMSIWGWQPNYFVETGLIPGNYSATVNPIYFEPVNKDYKDAYLRRYVNEMKKNRPVIFLDAVSPKAFYYVDTSFRHESFRILDDFVSQNYSIVNTIDGMRIYVIKSRLAERGNR